jgi:hypothetical protein
MRNAVADEPRVDATLEIATRIDVDDGIAESILGVELPARDAGVRIA